ncbi:MAG: zinc metallopeptidase, partial [Synergistaceae bacterium]|nr:zinc metallopeptidase [Synergistaceae bacterium]
MMPMMFDPTMILIIPALVFAFWAQSRVKSTFVTYSEIRARGGVTADSVSRTLLDRFGLQGVRVER